MLLLPLASIAGTHFAIYATGLLQIGHLLDLSYGVCFSMLVCLGWRAAPGAVIALTAIQMSLGVNLPIAVGLAGFETLAAGLAALLLVRVLNFRPGFIRQRDLFAFLIVGGAISPLLAGLSWALAYGVFNDAWSMYATVIKMVWLTHASGTLAIAPLILCVAAAITKTNNSAKRHVELAVVTTLAILSAHIAWCDPFGLGAGTTAFVFLPFAFSMWAALRLGHRSAALVTLLTVAVAASGTASGGGVVGDSTLHGSSSLLFAFIAISVSCAMLAATIIHERDALEQERRNLEIRVQQAEKLESLGMLAGGVAHDFNNLLTPILAGADLLALEKQKEGNEEILANIMRASRQARGLCQQMLAYAGRAGIEREVICVRSALVDAEPLVKHLAEQNIEIEFEYSDHAPPIEIDVTQLQQVLLNLVKNSTEAMTERGGTVRVATHARKADQEFLNTLNGSKQLEPGTYLGLEVSDQGDGIAERELSKVFDPFYSTKGSSRGLGLAGVIGITQAHGGGVGIESTVGVGTKITAWFPASSRPLTSASKTPWPPPATLEGTVLVVDDEQKVRYTARQLLERAGMDVLEADSGEDAIDLLTNSVTPVDLVILDLSMPGIDGHETFERMQLTHPNLPVILSSGYDQKRSEGSLAERGYAAFLQKPYESATLMQRVHEAMTGSSAS